MDEEGTHTRLTDHLRSLVDPKIAEHRGRVVKNTGDGLLAEFSSAVDAVRCAVDIQCGMVQRNCDVPEEKRIEFRIGVNVGDVIIDRGDIFGDDVNVAVRLEGLAEPGGICNSWLCERRTPRVSLRSSSTMQASWSSRTSSDRCKSHDVRLGGAAAAKLPPCLAAPG